VGRRGNDRELIEATLAGCREAFGELVARYKDAVFGVAFHILGDFEAARDAAQESFIKAYVKLGALRQRDRFGPWLRRIAEGTARNLARGLRWEAPLASLGDSMQAASTPHERAEQAEFARTVNEALATLSEPTRLAVILHYVDGYSGTEVAGFLGISPGAVRTRISRARSRLREELVKTMGDTLKNAAAEMSFSDQFLAGVIAALRAFGPPTASRMSDARPDWTEMFVDTVQSRVRLHADEVMSLQMTVGQGRFSEFRGGLSFLSDVGEHDHSRVAAVLQALSAPERIRLAARLAEGPANPRALAKEMSKSAADVRQDIQRLDKIGIVARNKQGDYALTGLGAHVLCLLLHLDNAFAPIPQPDS